MAVGKDKSRKHLSISQWAKKNKDLLNSVTFQDPHTEDKKWRSRREYRRWRAWVMLRDDYHCQWCGATKKLEAHHIVPASVCPELKYDLRNGITLCHDCHRKDYVHQLNPRFWKNFNTRKHRR